MTYYVQETIGCWYLPASFEGTYEQCLEFMEDNCFSGDWHIVSELDYKVDL